MYIVLKRHLVILRDVVFHGHMVPFLPITINEVPQDHLKKLVLPQAFGDSSFSHVNVPYDVVRSQPLLPSMVLSCPQLFHQFHYRLLLHLVDYSFTSQTSIPHSFTMCFRLCPIICIQLRIFFHSSIFFLIYKLH